MNTMELDGFTAIITYNAGKDWFRGVIQGLNGSADFHGKTTDELRREFRASLDYFLELCERHGRPAKKAASGRFVVRLPSDLHAHAAIAAQAAGVSLNSLVERAIRHKIHA